MELARTLIWLAWRARPDWTVADGSARLVRSLRLLRDALPEQSASWKVGRNRFDVDDPALQAALESTRDSPVFSWATWLSPRFATVDTTGLDVDVTEVGGGTLLVLRVDPVDLLDPDVEAGRDTVEELARRVRLAGR